MLKDFPRVMQKLRRLSSLKRADVNKYSGDECNCSNCSDARVAKKKRMDAGLPLHRLKGKTAWKRQP